jgi:hypothetical protein
VPRKATNLALVVRRSVACNDVVGDAKSALVVGLVQAHVNPGAVLLVPRLVGIPGALLQQCQCDLVVDVLLLEHVLFASCTWPSMYCSRVAWQKRMRW